MGGGTGSESPGDQGVRGVWEVGKERAGCGREMRNAFFFKFNNASEYFQNIFDSHFTSSQSLLRLSSK